MNEQTAISGSLALNSAPHVIMIPASGPVRTRKLRVAAYARVSSNSEDQIHSFAAQNAYYTELITGNPEWEFVDVYADEGITGTSAEKRDDFQRLLKDCRRGRIDKVLTKSTARFARNTSESLMAVRELRDLGIGVCFEEQGIDTAQMSGELLTAIFSMIAQKESEAISENIRWTYQKKMKKGSFITCKAPFGYRLVKGGLEIVEAEAEIIRLIFQRYPAILPEEQYRGAQERRRDRAVPVRKTPAQMELRRLCGGPPPAWVEQQTLTLLNRLVQHPERIASGQTEMEDPAESRKLRRELEEALQSPPVDGERTRNMALRLAEHRLNAIGAEEYETTRLQKLFRNHPLMEELERELLCESVRQITYRGKGIQVRLKNGQIMKGGQQP